MEVEKERQALERLIEEGASYELILAQSQRLDKYIMNFYIKK